MNKAVGLNFYIHKFLKQDRRRKRKIPGNNFWKKKIE